ncbi:MAG: ATP-binding protein [Ignavibacteria bacterium]
MKKLELVLKSNRSEVRKFEELLEKANQEFCLAMEKFINFQIACSEALINAIVHGNNEDESKSVYASLEYNEVTLSCRIRDEGKGFDMNSLPDPTSTENLLKESGRGIFIMRSLVDEFHCNSTESGTEFVLTARKENT